MMVGLMKMLSLLLLFMAFLLPKIQLMTGTRARNGRPRPELSFVLVSRPPSKIISSLEQRDEKMKREIILQVTEQITDFAASVNKSLGSLPAPPEKPDPDVLTSFHNNFPKTGTTYVVRSGDTISGIAAKFGSTRDWIQNANEISHPRFLQVGRTLFIPHK